MGFTIIAVAIGIVLGLALGGRPRNVGQRPVRATGALVAGVVLQVVPELVEVGGTTSFALVLMSYALLVAFAAVNLRLIGMPVVLVGLCLNAGVITANGAMPVRPSAIVAADVTTAEEVSDLELGAKRRLEEPGDAAIWLGDIIPVPGLREVVSFGDLILAAGVANVVLRLLKPPAVRRREEAEELVGDVIVFPPATVQPLRRSA